MPKPNRTCHCCGKGYYYCPSCSNQDPQIFVMWDSEKCREIYRTLSDESVGIITTAECKKKLIEFGVDEKTEFRDSVKKHANRVLSYEDKVSRPVEKNTVATKTMKPKRKSPSKKENSEVD